MRLVYELEESLDFEDDSYGLQPFAPFLELDDRDDGIFHSFFLFLANNQKKKFLNIVILSNHFHSIYFTMLVCNNYNGIGTNNGKVCCARSCGTCGGKGCSKRPGGKKNCCTKWIKKNCGTAPCRNGK